MKNNYYILLLIILLLGGWLWWRSGELNQEDLKSGSSAGAVIGGAGTEKPSKSDGGDSKENSSDKNPTDEIIYFYGEGCGHCKDLSQYLEENNVADKVGFSKKEVWSNPDNQQEFQQKAAECGLDKSQLGVPFIYAKGKCYVGGLEAQEFFESQMN